MFRIPFLQRPSTTVETTTPSLREETISTQGTPVPPSSRVPPNQTRVADERSSSPPSPRKLASPRLDEDDGGVVRATTTPRRISPLVYDFLLVSFGILISVVTVGLFTVYMDRVKQQEQEDFGIEQWHPHSH